MYVCACVPACVYACVHVCVCFKTQVSFYLAERGMKVYALDPVKPNIGVCVGVCVAKKEPNTGVCVGVCVAKGEPNIGVCGYIGFSLIGVCDYIGFSLCHTQI